MSNFFFKGNLSKNKLSLTGIATWVLQFLSRSLYPLSYSNYVTQVVKIYLFYLRMSKTNAAGLVPVLALVSFNLGLESFNSKKM